MSTQTGVPTLIELPNGVQVTTLCKASTDWDSVKMMIEAGVPYAQTAELFKIAEYTIRIKSQKEKWLTPSRVDKLKKELVTRQLDVYANTGMTKDVLELKAQIWEERGERWRERQAELVDLALEKTPKKLIKTAKDLKDIMEIGRKLTGESAAEDNAPKLAVNIGFLRGNNAPRQVTMDAEILEDGA